MSEWRPIEEFQWSGGCVLFCDEKHNQWIDTGPDLYQANGCGLPATHWMPLPDPPEGM